MPNLHILAEKVKEHILPKTHKVNFLWHESLNLFSEISAGYA